MAAMRPDEEEAAPVPAPKRQVRRAPLEDFDLSPPGPSDESEEEEDAIPLAKDKGHRGKMFIVTKPRDGKAMTPGRLSNEHLTKPAVVSLVSRVVKEHTAESPSYSACVVEYGANVQIHPGRCEPGPDPAGKHFHMVYASETEHRTKAISNSLRAQGFYHEIRPVNSYAAAFRYLTEPGPKKTRAQLDPAPLLSEGHPAIAGKARSTDAAGDVCFTPQRFGPEDLLDLVATRPELRTQEDVITYGRNHDARIAPYVLRRARSFEAELAVAWQAAGHEAALAKPQTELRRVAADRRMGAIGACAERGTCVCAGRWRPCAAELLAWHKAGNEVRDTIRLGLETGRQKGINPFSVGPKSGKLPLPRRQRSRRRRAPGRGGSPG